MVPSPVIYPAVSCGAVIVDAIGFSLWLCAEDEVDGTVGTGTISCGMASAARP